MKTKLFLLTAVLAAVPVLAMAQDASKEAPVEPAATVEAPPEVVSTQGTPPGAVVVPPEETKTEPRDAITGQPVPADENPIVEKEEEQSLRDKVRSKMDH